MKWQTILVALVAIPVLALFGGIGFLFYQIGDKWDARSTDSLITGLVATCGGGFVIMGLLMALIVGIPFAIRTYDSAGMTRRSWGEIPSRQVKGQLGLPNFSSKQPGMVDGDWNYLPSPGQSSDDVFMLPAPKQDSRFGQR